MLAIGRRARALPLLHGYTAVGIVFVGNMFHDAYQRAVDVCELFPQFEFAQTFQEELLLHHTRLPVLRWPVSTVILVAALLLGGVVLYFHVIEWLWLVAIEFFSGRWLYNLVYVHIPAWLPFLASDPGVPELLSDGEDEDEYTGMFVTDDVQDDESLRYATDEGISARPTLDGGSHGGHPMSHQQGGARKRKSKQNKHAMEKLVQIKMQHANHTVERPDDWLVFDPEQETLVIRKTHARADLEEEDDEEEQEKKESSSLDHGNSNGTNQSGDVHSQQDRGEDDEEENEDTTTNASTATDTSNTTTTSVNGVDDERDEDNESDESEHVRPAPVRDIPSGMSSTVTEDALRQRRPQPAHRHADRAMMAH